MSPPVLRLSTSVAALLTGFALPLSFFAHLAPHKNWLDLCYLYGVEYLIFLFQSALLLVFLVPLSFVLTKFDPFRIRGRLINGIPLLIISICFSYYVVILSRSLSITTGVEGLSLRWILVISAFFSCLFFLLKRLRRVAERLIPVCIVLGVIGLFVTLGTIIAHITHSLGNQSHQDANVVIRDKTEVSGRPNIILITVDTLSALHLPMYGYPRDTSPHLAEFAKSSVVVNRVYAVSNFTTSTVASILTGTYPWVHKATHLPDSVDPAVADQSLVANLERAGYETSYIGSNPFAGATRLGFGKYFLQRSADLFRNSVCLDIDQQIANFCAASMNEWISSIIVISNNVLDLLGAPVKHAYDSKRVLQRLQEWKPADITRPQFLWLHFTSPHQPYASVRPWLGTFNSSDTATSYANSNPRGLFSERYTSEPRIKLLRDRYDESILEVDSRLGDVFRLVDSRFGRNTVVIVTADHGESFSHSYGGHTGPMLYEELVRVPLLIRFPNSQKCSGSVAGTYSQIDITPTVLAAAGVAGEGDSIGVPIRCGVSVAADRDVYSVNFELSPRSDPMRVGSVAVVSGDWKLVNFYGAPTYPNMGERLRPQLFNVSDDPQESNNQYISMTDIDARLNQLIEKKVFNNSGL